MIVDGAEDGCSLASPGDSGRGPGLFLCAPGSNPGCRECILPGRLTSASGRNPAPFPGRAQAPGETLRGKLTVVGKAISRRRARPKLYYLVGFLDLWLAF